MLLFFDDVGGSPARSRIRGKAAFALELCVIGVCYFALAKFGLTLAAINPSATPIWPPTGFALAAVLLRGNRVAPATLIGAFLVNVMTAGSLATSAAIGLGNMLEAVAGAWFINRWSGGRDTFANAPDIACFALIVCLSTTLSATIGVTSLALGGFAEWSNFSSIWLTWWIGDLAGALVVTPVIVLWAQGWIAALRRRELADSLMLYAGTCAIGAIAFTPWFEPFNRQAPVGFLTILPLLWAALRRGQRDTATAALILTVFAVWGTQLGSGPFGRATQNEAFLLLLTFIISTTVPSLMLSAASVRKRAQEALARANQELETRVVERTTQLAEEIRRHMQTLEALQQSQERYRLVEEAVNDGIWDENLLTNELYLSPRWKSILGYADDEIPNAETAFLDLIHPDDVAAIVDKRREYLEAKAGKSHTLDFRLRRKNGDYCWVHSRGTLLRDAANRPVRMLDTITDVSERKRAQAVIEESRNNLERAETMALMGHYRIDIAPASYKWSEGLYRIMGKSPGSFNPTLSSVLELIHPDDRPALEQYRRDVVAGVDPPRTTKRVVKDDGQIAYIECWSVPIRASDGTVTGVFGTIQDITARKLAEAELHTTRAFLDAVIENLPIMISVKNASDQTYVLANRASEKLFNLPAAQVIGKRVQDVVAPEQAALFASYDRDVLAARKLVSFEHDVEPAEGTVRRRNASKVPILGDDGEPQYIITLSEDITDRKHAQQALLLSEERYRMVESAVNGGIWDWNLLTGEAYMSPRWKAILGYADDELPNLASSFFDRIHPGDKAVVTEAIRTDLEDDAPYVLDFQLRCKNGDYRWVHGRGRIWRDAADRPVRMLGSITDISEQKEAEQALQQSQELNRLVGSTINDGLWDWNILTDDDYLSPRWKAILGYADDEVPNLKSSFYNLLHPDDRATALEATRAHLEEQKPYALDLRMHCKNGDYRWVHSRGQAIYDAANRPVRMIGAVTDITDRKRAEAEMTRTNLELERRVSERTAELAEEMRKREKAQMTLAQAQKMEAVGQLTAGVAHDFNNLLAVIQGGLEFVEAAAARGVTAEAELIDATLRATRRGRELVQRLLAFARQAPLKAEPTPIDQLVLDTLRLLQRTLGERIDIVTRLDGATAAALVDRNQLVNALMNLALNARDAMPEGGLLTLATKCRPSRWAATEGSARWPTGEEVRITVGDTGVGMTEEVCNRAFEPFFTTKRDGLGTGLGLSMVQGFVEQSGGHIEIDSAFGRGTTITICLPRIAAPSDAVEPDAAVGLSTSEPGKTILLVEDDPDVRIVMAAQLKQLGYKVHAVANGNEAVDLIESPAKIDIMLTDVVLPGGIDGVTLIKDAMRTRPTMGVLCMSGYDPTHTHLKWLEVQNIEFLEKPFSRIRLAQALDGVLAA